MHRSERDHSTIDIVSRPSHPRNIISPESLTGATTDCIDSLRNELVVERQGDVPRIEQSIISYVERTRGVAGHSPFEGFFRNINPKQLFGGVAFAVDVGRLASLALWFSFVAFDAPFATREASGLCTFLRHSRCGPRRSVRSYRDPNRDILML